MTQELPPADPMASYVVHLWRRKWWIVIATAVAFIAATVAMRFKHGEAYTASANLFVKTKQFDVGVQGSALTPVPYKTLLLSDELLYEVRDEAAKMLGVADGRAVEPFEAFAGAFQVITETEADTTVRKDYSPVMTAKFTWSTSDGAQGILDLWLRRFIEKYGSLHANQAAVLAAAAKLQYDKKRAELESLEADRATIEADLGTRRQALRAKQYLLSPVPPPEPEPAPTNPLPGHQTQQLNVETPVESRPEAAAFGQGLMAKAAELKIEIAGAPEGKSTTELQRSLSATEEAIQSLEAETAALQKETAELDKRRSVLVADIGATKAAMQSCAENLSQFTLGVESGIETEKLPYEGSDVRVVARPVPHDSGAGINKRLMITASTVAVFVFSLLFFLAEKYLRDALAAVSGK